jgi:hypothetical protein
LDESIYKGVHLMKQHTYAKWLLAIACGHLLVGALLLGQGWWEIIQAGWVNVAGPNNLNAAVTVWFFMFSFPLMMVVASLWNGNEQTPAATLWLGIFGSVLGISLMPLSGFWFWLILCVIALVQSKNSSAQRPVAI